MGWIRKIISKISPNKVRSWGYDAGSYAKENKNWFVPMGESYETTARNNRDLIRNRARDLERNSDMAKSVVHAFRRNVVGAGFRLQSRTGKANFNAEIEKAWRKWTKAKDRENS